MHQVQSGSAHCTGHMVSLSITRRTRKPSPCGGSRCHADTDLAADNSPSHVTNKEASGHSTRLDHISGCPGAGYSPQRACGGFATCDGFSAGIAAVQRCRCEPLTSLLFARVGYYLTRYGPARSVADEQNVGGCMCAAGRTSRLCVELASEHRDQFRSCARGFNCVAVSCPARSSIIRCTLLSGLLVTESSRVIHDEWQVDGREEESSSE